MLLAKEWEKRSLRFQLTPYMQAIAEKDNEGNPLLTDPIWRQFFPAFDELLSKQEQQVVDEYSPERENWEIAEEMLTPIAHHKYNNRVILYTACMFRLLQLLSAFASIQSERRNTRWQGVLATNNGSNSQSPGNRGSYSQWRRSADLGGKGVRI